MYKWWVMNNLSLYGRFYYSLLDNKQYGVVISITSSMKFRRIMLNNLLLQSEQLHIIPIENYIINYLTRPICSNWYIVKRSQETKEEEAIVKLLYLFLKMYFVKWALNRNIFDLFGMTMFFCLCTWYLTKLKNTL